MKHGRRVALEALDDLFGLAFVFPESDDPTDESYMTADLSGLVLEEEQVPGDEEEDVDEG